MRLRQTAIAKISRPVIPGIAPRKRLFKLLDNSLRRPVAWISSPAGSGKTTLISSYLDSRKLPCIWYQCDEGDSDPATFFYYMGLAAKKAAPRHKASLPLLTPEYLAGIPTFTRRYFEELYSSLITRYASLKKPRLKKVGKGHFTIVLDNYQEAPADSSFHDMIANGFDIIPDGVHVVVISRGDPPSALARLHANDKVSVLEYRDIRFTFEESKELVHGRIPGLTNAHIKTMHEKTEGWAAGIILMLAREKLTGPRAESAADFAHHGVFDYFAGEVFGKIENEVQDFLLKTAFLPMLSVPQAEKLTGTVNAGRILAALSRQHYFTQRLSGSGQDYQYHPLFREFLISRARARFAPGELSLILRKTSLVLAESGQTESAASLFAEVTDWDNLVRLILNQAKSLMTEGRSMTLEGWLRKLPGETLENNPQLLHLLGLCRMPFDSKESRSLFEKAFLAFEAMKDTNGALMACFAIMDAILAQGSDYKALGKWLDWLDRVEERGFSFPSLEIELEAASKMLFATYYQPWHPRMGHWRSRAEALIACDIDTPNLIAAGLSMIIHYVFFGLMRKAAVLLETLRPRVASKDVRPFYRVQWQMAEILYAIYGLALREAYLEETGKGKALSLQTGIPIFDRFFFYYEIIGGLIAGNTNSVERLLREMDSPEYNSNDRSFHIIYLFMLVWKDLAGRDAPVAIERIRHTLPEIENLGPALITIFNHIGMSHALFGTGKPQEALLHLSNARAMVARMDSPLCTYMILITDAYFALKRGRESKGLELIGRAMALGREWDIMAFPYSTQAVMGYLCTKSLEAGIEPEYARELIRKHNLKPDISDIAMEAWPYPIKIYTLGRFEIIKDDKPLVFIGKTQKKPLELLMALIAFGGRDVAVDTIIDVLWPEVDGDLANKSFEMTLSRLRRLLGRENFIKYSARQLTIDPLYCWVDSLALEHITAMTGKTPDKQILSLCKKAVGLYKGHFLPSCANQGWAAGRRESLKNSLIRIIVRVGHHYEQAGQWENAVEYYLKGLNMDNLAEEFYQRVMLCYGKIDNKAEAVKAYKRCLSLFRSELGIEPSDKTKAIYSSILQRDRHRDTKV